MTGKKGVEKLLNQGAEGEKRSLNPQLRLSADKSIAKLVLVPGGDPQE